MIASPPPEATVECDGCDARCCRAFILRAPVRMNRRGGWQLDGKLRPMPPGQSSFADKGIPLKVVKIRHGQAVLDCQALVDDRCSVYADRPQLCRTYDCRADVERVRQNEGGRCTWPRDLGSGPVSP